MQSERIEVEGMSCSHCVARVKEALAAVRGVEVEWVGIGEVQVSFSPDGGGREAVLAAISAAGYTAK